MRFHCVGVGSIGALVAFHLRRANPAPSHAFTLLVRPKSARRTTPQAQPNDGIYVESNRIRRQIGGFDIETLDSATHHFNLLPLYSGTEAASKPRPSHLPKLPIFSSLSSKPSSVISSLIVTNKAPTVRSTIEELKTRLNASSTIVLLQNGMGIYDHLVEKVFPDPDTRPNFVLGSTTHAVWAKRRFDVVHAATGTLNLAIVPDPLKRRDFEARTPHSGKALDPSAISVATYMEDDPKFFSLAETIKAFLRCRDLHVQWTRMSEMDVVLRRKVAVNACIGPLTSLLDCPNGALFGNMAAHRTIRRVCHEAAEVFSAEAEEIESSEEGSGKVDRSWPTALSGRALEEYVVKVVQDTSKNWSSMHQDIKNMKPTEIEYINAYLTRTGSRLGVPTPHNDMLVELVRLKRQIPSGSHN